MEITQSALRIVFVSGRAASEATEMFFYAAERYEPRLYLDLWGGSGSSRLGYAELRRAGEEEGPDGVTLGLYELARLHGADFPCQGPVASLSGVLWSRREVLARFSAESLSQLRGVERSPNEAQ
ncbi:hypothetical protein D3C84_439120 [compost metagenome]